MASLIPTIFSSPLAGARAGHARRRVKTYTSRRKLAMGESHERLYSWNATCPAFPI
jgi:hypothetical protein